jgi:hypothetical protein
MSNRTIVVAGALAQRPHRGGHAWVFLQYLLGFRRLGFDVLFVDRLAREWCVDESGEQVAPEHSRQVGYLDEVMHAVEPIPYAVVLDDGGVVGMEPSELATRLRGSVLMLDVMGYLAGEELLAGVPLRVFLDIDPGFPQMWRELDWADVFGRHDAYVTVGGNMGKPECTIPTCGIDWITMLPPVVQDLWPEQREPGRRVTSVATWRGPFASVDYLGATYGLRAHEFRRFASLPERCEESFELALDIDDSDGKDRTLLTESGWRLVDPLLVASDVRTYRDYVQDSRCELMVAKGMYVRSRSGWFSDRSACYLASGRPVVAQDTGISELLPVGEGLLCFSTLDEAVEAFARIRSDEGRHRRAARKLAEGSLSSDLVLGGLLDRLGT